MMKLVERVRGFLSPGRRTGRRMPGWVEAIGTQIALRFDVTREPLPDRMDHVLHDVEQRKEAMRHEDDHRRTQANRR